MEASRKIADVPDVDSVPDLTDEDDSSVSSVSSVSGRNQILSQNVIASLKMQSCQV